MNLSNILVFLTVLLIIICSFTVYGHNTKKKVNHLPGMPAYSKRSTSNMYTGFVNVDEATDTNLFYMLVEAEENPMDKPLIWWMNGGPGASSFAGLFGENGPYLLKSDMKLLRNPYSWNNIANVLYVEFAPGIGYSYCKSSYDGTSPCPQTSGSCSPCNTSDTLVAEQNLKFLQSFIIGDNKNQPLFPEYKGRPLYIAGESYAGVYIPTFTQLLLETVENVKDINLNGIFVTDPCTSNKYQFGWLDLNPRFAYEKGIISMGTLNTIESKACSSGRTSVGDYRRQVKTVDCRKAWRMYDIALAGIGNAVQPNPIYNLPMYIDPLNAFGPSGGPNLPGYLNLQDVKTALNANGSKNKVYHIEIGNNGYPNYHSEYSACNNNPDRKTSDMLDIYKEIMMMSKEQKPSTLNFKTIIVSSGDIDPVVNLHGTEKAIEALNLTEVNGGVRRPWFFNGTGTDMGTIVEKPWAWGQTLHTKNSGPQIGGFTRNFNTTCNVDFHFVTIRDSGHMTPAYAPLRVLHMINHTLVNHKFLSTVLPSNFESVDDTTFYGTEDSAGIFTKWVLENMEQAI